MRTISLFSISLLAAMLRADCPTPVTSDGAWGVGTPISYSWPGSMPGSAWTDLSVDTLGIADDINAAFNEWTYANQSQNSTENTFYYSNTGTAVTVSVY